MELTLPADADLGAARRALEGTDITAIRLTRVDNEGAQLQLKAPVDGGRDREAREAEVRELAQSALREAGVLRAT